MGPNPLPPGGAVGSIHTASIYTALCSAHKGLGDGQRPSPSRQAHRPTRVSEGKGSGGGEDVGQGARVEDAPAGEMQVGGNGGGDAYLSCVPFVVVHEISNIQVWKLASRFGDLRQGQALNRGLQRELIFLSMDAQGVQCLHDWQLFPRGSSTFPRAVHAHWPPYATRACKRGVGPCARSRGRGAPGSSIARRPTRFAWQVPARRARPGPR